MQGLVVRGASFVRSVFWILPWLLLSTADTSSPRTVLVAGTVCGFVWQLVHRRDLVDRLTALAVVWVVLVFCAAIFPDPTLEPGPTSSLAGLVMGLVVAELGLRNRDLRRPARGPGGRTRPASARREASVDGPA